MLQKVRTIDRRLLVRRCVACGYDGGMLLGGQAHRCARCGCDLHNRPPRSYAEMEGLIGQPITLSRPPARHVNEERAIHRWLATLFFALIGLIAIAYLTAEALAV